MLLEIFCLLLSGLVGEAQVSVIVSVFVIRFSYFICFCKTCALLHVLLFVSFGRSVFCWHHC